MDSVRLDKFLWAVRLHKTRPEAADACRLGRVEMGGQPVKAAREVRVGDVISVQSDELTKTVRVLAVLDKRVAGKLVSGFIEDLTPPDEYERAKKRREEHALNLATSPPLRPTKRDRRDIDAFLDAFEAEARAEDERQIRK
jgi:ribosome-associated heat shock protein Hsp15